MNEYDIKIAAPEKAIIDVLYLSPSKTRLFASLPEFEFTANFDYALAKEYIHKLPSQGRRTLVETLFAQLYSASH